jgi:hypothetical protein
MDSPTKNKQIPKTICDEMASMTLGKRKFDSVDKSPEEIRFKNCTDDRGKITISAEEFEAEYEIRLEDAKKDCLEIYELFLDAHNNVLEFSKILKRKTGAGLNFYIEGMDVTSLKIEDRRSVPEWIDFTNFLCELIKMIEDKAVRYSSVLFKDIFFYTELIYSLQREATDPQMFYEISKLVPRLPDIYAFESFYDLLKLRNGGQNVFQYIDQGVKDSKKFLALVSLKYPEFFTTWSENVDL